MRWAASEELPWRRTKCLNFDQRSAPEHPQVIVGIDEEFEIGLHLLESKMPQITVTAEPVEVTAPRGFKRDDGIQPRLASRHAHDLQHRLLVKVVIQLVFIDEEQIG